MNFKQTLAITATTVGLSLLGSNAQAALITGVTVSTDMGSLGGTDITNTVNGVGWPGDVPALTGTHAASTQGNTWIGSLDSGNTITFDLGDSYDLAGFSFWNFNGVNTAGIQNVTVQSSTDGTNFSTISGAPTVFAQANFDAPQDPELFSFNPVTASFVRFLVGSNYGLTDFGNATGFAEVQFDGTLAATETTPEQGTLLGLMVLGGGLLASKTRKG